MWDPITGVTAIVALIISLISFGINLYDRSRKNMRMSWNQLDQEIARICRKHSMYSNPKCLERFGNFFMLLLCFPTLGLF